jgi:hypothetical protein
VHPAAFVAVFLLVLNGVCAVAQTSSVSQSDAQAISLAQNSFATLTNGSSIRDATVTAHVVSILGSDNEAGTGTFKTKGNNESRVDLALPNGTRIDIRNVVNGIPSGAWAKISLSFTPYAQHNCWTDAAWFFPASSSLGQTANPAYVFKYIGQEEHRGSLVNHIRVFQPSMGQALSSVDFFLDPVSFLPAAIGFNTHADDDMNTSIPVEINFANYQRVTNILVPFHFQKMLNGGVVLDVTVTGAVINTGLPDSLFGIP